MAISVFEADWKYYHLQSGWFVHHPDRIFKGVLTIQSEFWNSISGICYGHISIWGRLRENITPSNQDDLHIILIAFSRGFWPSDQNFEIPSVASAMAILVFEADCGKILSSPIRMISTSSWPQFQGDSEYPIRIFKFHQWHLLWLYQCFTQILGNINIHQWRWSIYHVQLFLWDILNPKSEVSNYGCSIDFWPTSIQHVERCSICTIILYQCIQPLELHETSRIDVPTNRSHVWWFDLKNVTINCPVGITIICFYTVGFMLQL